MSFLVLNDARILHVHGWGVPTPGLGKKFGVEFASDGYFFVLRQGMFGAKRGGPLHMGYLELRTWTHTVHTGGGFVGVGFDMKSVADGMLSAEVLNMLTARQHEYALLGVFYYPPGGASCKEYVFGFRDVDESRLREQVFGALPAWAEDYIENKLLSDIAQSSEEVLLTTYVWNDQMQARGMFTDAQHQRVETELAKLVPRPAAQPVEGAPVTDRIGQLKTLAELLQSGALTQPEFEAEKARLLASA